MSEDDDPRIESAVLFRVIELHPARLTVAELSRELEMEPETIERAAAGLGRAGLLHEADQFVTPTRTAVRLSELLAHGT